MSKPLLTPDYAPDSDQRSTIGIVAMTCSAVSLATILIVLFVVEMADEFGLLSLPIAVIGLIAGIIAVARSRTRTKLAIVSLFLNAAYWGCIALAIVPKLMAMRR